MAYDQQLILDSYKRAIDTAEEAQRVGDNAALREAVDIANQLKAQIDSFGSEQPVAAQSQQASYQRPEVVSTITGMTPGKAQARGEAGAKALEQGATEAFAAAARYGPAIAVQVAQPELGVGYPTISAALRGMAGLSAKTAAAQVAGSMAAQVAESSIGLRDKIEPKQIAQETLTSAFPQLQKGGLMARSLVNSALSVGAFEAAQALDNDGYNRPKTSNDYLLRIGLPVVLSSAASTIASASETASKARLNIEEATKKRFGGGVLLSEAVPGATNLEKSVIQKGNELANRALINVGANIGDEIDRVFKDIPSTSEASALLASQKGLLTRLQGEYNKAQAAANDAQKAFEDQKRINGDKIPQAYADAQKAALEASKQRIIYEHAVDSMFPSFTSDAAKNVAEGARKTALSDLADNAKTSVKSQINDLYQAAGVGENDPVINRQSALAAISSPKFRGPGGLLEDNESYSIAKKLLIDRFDQAYKAVAKFKTTTPGQMTLGQFRRFRDDVADALINAGKDRDKASRFASGMYEALQDSSDNFVKRFLTAKNPVSGRQQFKAYQFARDAARADFVARSTGAIDAISSGDISGLYSSIVKQGAGPVLNEIDAYANSIARSGIPNNQASIDAALKASDSFKNSFYKVVADSVIDENLVRGTGHSTDRIFDVAGLAKSLSSLESKGFPVEKLGLGNSKTINALARVSSAGTTAGYTVSELAKFFDDAAIVGADKAAARVQYYRDVQDSFLNGRTGMREPIYRQNQLRKTAKNAAVDASIANEALDKAKNSPLAVLMDKVDLGQAPSIPIANGNELVSQLLQTNPYTVEQLMKVLPENTANDIRRATAATVMRQFEGVVKSGKPTKANLTKLTEFFTGLGTDQIKQREAFANILGKDQYNSIFRDMYGAVESAVKATKNVDASEFMAMGTTPLAAGRAKARVGDIAFYTSPSNIFDWIKSGRYNLLYNLFVNPEIAPSFKKASGSLANFTRINAVNRHIVDMANRDDGYPFTP